MAATAAEVEAVLADLLHGDTTLFAAMRHGTLGGGKRLRPFLVVTVAAMFDAPREQALRMAAAVELVHSYSLIHDDLPAMDDDDLRRGQPTVHRAYDEATAILAGDGLLTLAFEVLADAATHPNAATRCQLIAALAAAAGARGMVAGQMLDLAAADAESLSLDQIIHMQRLKTGALIECSCLAGAILAGAQADARQALSLYAQDIGLAFQVADDLLDVDGDAREVGKALRKDADGGKATFVALLGLEEARAEAARLADSAIARLALFGEKADLLREIARFIVSRRA
ncbi:MAG: polyprenyl synthetase family protein [Alphaproteobacteria bacterium]